MQQRHGSVFASCVVMFFEKNFEAKQWKSRERYDTKWYKMIQNDIKKKKKSIFEHFRKYIYYKIISTK